MPRRLSVLSLVAASAIAAGLILTPPAGATAPQRVSVTGQVQVVDTIGGAVGHKRFQSLVTSDRTWRLVASRGIALPTGARVQVDGTASHGVLTARHLTVLSAPPASATTGTQSLYVIRVAWSGNAADSVSTTNIQQLGSRLNTWFDEVSYGKLPGFTLSQDSTYETIATPDNCRVPGDPAGAPYGAQQIYDRAVTAAGITATQYDHIVVYFPLASSGCSFAGLASIDGRSVWLNGDLTDRVVTHEVGHNLTLRHSHSLDCHDPNNVSVQVMVSTACSAPTEYGDPADSMGSEGADTAGHYNAAQKDKLGWLGSTLQAVVPCTSLTLQPYEVTPSSGIVAARIDAGADSVSHQPIRYYLEYRHPDVSSVDATDGPLPAGNLDGVLVHMTDPIVTSPTNPNTGPDLLDARTNDAAYNFDDAAIPASTTTAATPQGITFAVGTVGSTASVTLATSQPSVPRGLSAVRSGSNVQVSWLTPGCPGTGATSITGYHLTKVGGSTVATSSLNATSSGVPGQAGAEYLVTATSDQAVTGPAAVVPATAPQITGVDLNYIDAAAVDFDTSLSNGGHTISYYVVHAQPVGGAPAVDDNYYDITTHSDKRWYLIGEANSNGDTYDVTVVPEYSDFTRGPASKVVRITIGDQAAPKPSMKKPASTTTLAASAAVAWGATDSGGAGVKSYDVRYRKASSSSGLGAYTPLKSNTTTTSTTVPMAAGSTYCFSVRARDGNNNLSGYSAEKCTSRPLDDADLSVSGVWTHPTGSSYFRSTLSSSTRQGASLSHTGLKGKHLQLLASTCSTCGKVDVLVNGSKIATVDLHATSSHDKVLFAVSLPAALSNSTVKLRVATAGKPVKIDGLVVRAV